MENEKQNADRQEIAAELGRNSAIRGNQTFVISGEALRSYWDMMIKEIHSVVSHSSPLDGNIELDSSN